MRKENIEHVAREHARQNFPPIESASMYRTGKTAGYISGFIDGAQWVINSVWHDAKEVPKDKSANAAILAIPSDESSFYITFLNTAPRWESYVKRNEIKCWAYVTDLLPERKEEAK